jgi:bifunctional DNase/RNase
LLIIFIGMIRFVNINYTHKIIIDLDSKLLALFDDTIPSDSIEYNEITHRPFPVENNILDRFSQELSHEINSDMFKMLIDLSYRK